MTVTMALIARRLNLSQATVSRVLSGKGKGFISEATRKRVMAVAGELGYVPSKTETTRPPRRMGVVALWIRNPNAPYYARIVRKLQSLAQAEGSDLVLSGFNDEGGEPDFEVGMPRAVSPSAWNVDGIVAIDCPRRIQAYLARARSRAAPVLVAGSEPVPGVDSVVFDAHSGAAAATAHLVKLGRKNIAHLTGDCSIPSIRQARADAYMRQVQEAGQPAIVLSARDETRGAARQCVRQAVEDGQQFDALFCLNDDMAIGAYRGLLDVGRRVPHDVAIVGYDCIEDTEYLEVPLTSVHQNHEVMVKRSWELLWRRIDAPSAELVAEILMPELVVRSSCGSRMAS